MADNNVVVLDDNDDSSSSDVEIVAVNAADGRSKRDDGDDVKFIKSTSNRRKSTGSTASASISSDGIQFVGTKRPPPNGNRRASFPHQPGIGMSGVGFGGLPMPNNLMNQTNDYLSRISVPRRGPQPFARGSSSKMPKENTTTAAPKAMLKGKAMQQPEGFDAIDINYPRLTANDRTMILHFLLSNCTGGYTKTFTNEFRVKFEKTHPKPTLWSLAKALSEEITRLEGDTKMPATKKHKAEGGSHNKENKQNRNGRYENQDKKNQDKTSIGSLSDTVLNTLTTYFRAHLGQKDHKAMLDSIEPTESPTCLTCCVCSDAFNAEDTVACSGEDIHFFCKPCLSSYCTVTLQSGSIQSVPCAMPDCKSLFATHDIKSVLSDFDILKIEHREESRDRRVALAAKAILHCECGVVAIVTEEDLGDGRITCPGDGCGRRFCAKCGNEDHGKEGCPPPAETVQWLDKYSKECPNCSNRIEKNGGCDHMTCRPPGGCGFEFWWTCGCAYRGQHKCGRR